MENVNTEKSDLGLPSEVERFSFQVAGHGSEKYGKEHGIFKHENGSILKPLFEGNLRSATELAFYETVFQNEQNTHFVQLKELVPKFTGIWAANAFGKKTLYLCLENLCANFLFPSVLDIKMGKKSYDKYASKEKQLDMQNKYVCGEKIGVRVTGIKTYNFATKEYEVQPKQYLFNRTVDNLILALEKYFTSDSKINHLIIASMLHSLERVDEYMQKQQDYEFIGSSLLFVYEGNIPAWTELLQMGKDDQEVCDLCCLNHELCTKIQHSSLIRTNMIDFAHTYPNNSIDENYLYGLKNLKKYFKILLNRVTGKKENVDYDVLFGSDDTNDAR